MFDFDFGGESRKVVKTLWGTRGSLHGESVAVWEFRNVIIGKSRKLVKTLWGARGSLHGEFRKNMWGILMFDFDFGGESRKKVKTLWGIRGSLGNSET